jgi:hypothetical protein
MRRFFSCILFLLVFASFAKGWSYKEHILLTRLAVERLVADSKTPLEMKEWLRQITPDISDVAGEKDFFLNKAVGVTSVGLRGITYWSVMPDQHAEKDAKDSIVEPFGVHERMLHFLDVEYFKPGVGKAVYKSDLSGRPRVGDFPHDWRDLRYKKAGMLPLRVEDCYRKLVVAIPKRHGDDPNDPATQWAGYLCHYLADSTQPQHGTVDYKSHSYFPDPRSAPNVHAQMEYVMCDDAGALHMGLREEYWPVLLKQMDAFDDPNTSDDPWEGTLETILGSYEAIPLIGQAAVAAWKDNQFSTEVFFHFKGKYGGKEMSVLEMKAMQQAWAVCRIEKTLLKAWKEANSKSANQNPKEL